MAQVSDWEGELFRLSSKAFATPGCFPKEGSMLCAGKWETAQPQGEKMGTSMAWWEWDEPWEHFPSIFTAGSLPNPPSYTALGPRTTLGMVLTPSGRKGYDKIIKLNN